MLFRSKEKKVVMKSCSILPSRETNKPASSKDIKYEKCVVCGKETSVSTDMHIANRVYYVTGAGQLCKSCYNNIYNIHY